MITHDTYSTQLFQLRFKVFPELSGKVENERERLNTVLKCLVRYILLQDCQPPLVRTLLARIKLRFNLNVQNKIFLGFWAQNEERSETNPLVYGRKREN